MKMNALKKHLSDESIDELTKQIIELFKKNDFVKDYYKLKYDSEYNSAVLAKQKEIIKISYEKARLSVAKKSISEFTKLSNDKEQIAEIMLYYVEMGVEFTNNYGDIDESFYSSMEGMFEQVVIFLVKEKLENMFVDRCYNVVEDRNGIGWGFHDGLSEIFHGYMYP